MADPTGRFRLLEIRREFVAVPATAGAVNVTTPLVVPVMANRFGIVTAAFPADPECDTVRVVAPLTPAATPLPISQVSFPA